MPWSERLCNVLFGLSVMSWAVLGLLQAGDAARWTPVRLVIAALNLCVGCLLLWRAPVSRHGSPTAVLLSVPSLIAGGWALNAAPPPQSWPWYAELTFVVGGALVLVAFAYLGRSFAIFPAVRDIVVEGPFRIVRHPAYAGELLLAASCCLARPSLWTAAPLAVALPLVALRIRLEEQLLMNSSQYARYTRTVRWRLLPLLW